ncbi:MAG: diguanylate cyclase/phosphodiesterase (GGDEF & EAL domains) with PAS/PAC sensor(s) [Candidatus Carbobacillus altaicus]|uniref:Diguanylate cyclase/phosphodiesterase (GGDEF & EAL domains) with PAS/PAC sensor(S) n=1 Tax=Candidatus Carbonibacillus altaicus TaxID=2163959 RepID=A0A2R6XXC0_9BACL|nr:MAG: diguanylate cyclase/phosphodiesterase (GGDEF & EAL domains) with PAS/PAC sensor(s) [Candidatus Carbobacillus altaicus]
MMISLVSELTDQAVKLIQLLEKEKNFAERDSLTGLPNRLALEQRASLLLGAQPKLIIMFNIHRLTYINEQYGRDIGDMVIAIVAERLGKLFPGEGQLFKVAGDEFLAVLDDATLDNGALEYVALDHAALEDSHLEQDAFDHITLNRGAYEGSAQGMSGAKEETKKSLRSKRLEAIHQALHVPVELPDRVLSVQVDIGVALYPEHGADLFDLWRKANLALLKARMHHKRYQLFYPGVETSFLRDLSLKSSLRIAVQHGDFTLVFQPIYDLASERIVAAEVLLRWDEAAPDVLIPLAEELGLMAEIDHFVLTQANAISKMLPVPLAVNLSPTTVAHKKDAGHILSLADPQRITLEVTEHAVTNAAAVKNLRRLQKAGFKIALDDFGKGYSHLALLPELPLTALKLDRFFVQHIHEPRYRIILESIVAIAKHEAYRLELVAEGIEDRASLNFLRSLNIDRVQGYALSRPLPLEDLQKKLHRGDNSFYNDRKLHG